MILNQGHKKFDDLDYMDRKKNQMTLFSFLQPVKCSKRELKINHENLFKKILKSYFQQFGIFSNKDVKPFFLKVRVTLIPGPDTFGGWEYTVQGVQKVSNKEGDNMVLRLC